MMTLAHALRSLFLILTTANAFSNASNNWYISKASGTHTTDCNSPQSPSQSLADVIPLVAWDDRFYLDGTKTEHNPYTCVHMTSQYRGFPVYFNMSLSVVGQNSPAHIFCPDGIFFIGRFTEEVFPNKEKERKILSLAVRCGGEDCELADELRLKEPHLGVCPFRVVPCPDCKITMAQKDLDTHRTKQCPLKMVKCNFCQEQYPDWQMKVYEPTSTSGLSKN